METITQTRLAHIIKAMVLDNLRLRLIYDDGAAVVVDFAPIAAQGGVFAPLSDPAFFAGARLQERGRVVAWPGELEFCADALREQGAADEAPSLMTACVVGILL